ncbi:TRAP transporter substrate-binding protein [bacterium]|nr:TRAP transporter substrate-binding protein [bacterium]
MKKLFALGIVALSVVWSLQVIAAQPVTLKLASFVSPKSITNSATIPAFIKAVEAASEGTLKIEHYPGGTLGSSPKSQLKLVEDGVVDIAEVVAAYTPGRFPELALFELPFEFSSSEEAGLTAWIMYEKGLMPSMSNLEMIGIAQVGPYTIHTRMDISSPAKLKGLKLRAGGPIQGKIIEELGAVPIGGIGATKIAEAISRRVLDGCLMDDGNLFNFRIADATKYHVLNVQLGNVAVFFPMNKAKYDSLPPKAKAALDQYRGEWFTRLLNRNLDGQIIKGIETIRKDSKHTVSEWSAAEVAQVKASMASIKNEWDVTDAKGVNLYQEMLKARTAVQAKMK